MVAVTVLLALGFTCLLLIAFYHYLCLEVNGLVGTIPTEIALLKDLERLDLGTFGLCVGFENKL